jgi:hypothetical protein
VSTFTRQFVLLSALLAAWCIQGGAARAGYVSITEQTSFEGHAVNFSNFAPMDTDEIAGSTALEDTERNDDRTTRDSERLPHKSLPWGKKPPFAWHFDHGGNMGSTSSSPSGSAPSSQPAGGTSRLEVPAITVVALLPPQTGESHPFSVTSFLFRPPRAA